MFSNAKGYEEFIPIQSKKHCNDGLVLFINEVGIPKHLVSDGALEQGGFGTYKTNWNATQRKYSIYQTLIQSHCPRQNTAELSIGHLSRDITKQTVRSCSPKGCGHIVEYYVQAYDS